MTNLLICPSCQGWRWREWVDPFDPKQPPLLFSLPEVGTPWVYLRCLTESCHNVVRLLASTVHRYAGPVEWLRQGAWLTLEPERTTAQKESDPVAPMPNEHLADLQRAAFARELWCPYCGEHAVVYHYAVTTSVGLIATPAHWRCEQCLATFEKYDDGAKAREQRDMTEAHDRAEYARLQQKYGGTTNA